MFFQLLLGSFIIALSIAIHSAFVAIAIKALYDYGDRLSLPLPFIKMLLVLIATTIWLLIAHSLSIWLWAIVFILLDAFQTLEPAVYFSLVAFTTLGFGDITLSTNWRILSGMTASNGLLLFGFSTAFLFEVIRQLHKAYLGQE